MPVAIQMDPSEKSARENPICLGCFSEKGIGLVVCWTCFKIPGERPAFKYFQGTIDQWLLLEKVKN